MPDEALLTAESIEDFFRELLRTAIGNQRTELSPETELYLARLLGSFLSTDALFSPDEPGRRTGRPLAFLLKDALEEEGLARAQLLKKLGDQSLFVSGFFPDSLSRGLVGVDYYIAMGERAYEAVDDVLVRRVARDTRGPGVFGELAAKFGRLVGLFQEVSERTMLSTHAGVQKLYEKWLRTGSARLGWLLREEGALVAVPVSGRRTLA